MSPLPKRDNIIRSLHVGLVVGAVGRLCLGAIAFVAAATLFEFGSPQPVGATELGPFFWMEPPTVQIEDRPKPLYAPYGYYGYQGGCSRQPVWQGRRWRSVTVCRR